MLIHVPQMSDPLTRVIVATADRQIAKYDAISPFSPSPFVVELPSGVSEDDVEIRVVGLDNRGQPIGDPILTKQRKPANDPPANDPPANDPPANDPAAVEPEAPAAVEPEAPAAVEPEAPVVEQPEVKTIGVDVGREVTSYSATPLPWIKDAMESKPKRSK